MSVLLSTWMGPAMLVGRIAAHRGYSFTICALAALFLFWPFFLIVTLVIPRHAERARAQAPGP